MAVWLQSHSRGNNSTWCLLYYEKYSVALLGSKEIKLIEPEETESIDLIQANHHYHINTQD